MAYPFVPFQRLGIFKEKVLGREDISFIEKEGSVGDSEGNVYHVDVLERRTKDGRTLRLPLQCPGGDDTVLSHTVLRSYCARLEIDPSMFGFDLG